MLVVCDQLWDAVEQVFFCQVILILGGAADDIVADRALGVSGEGEHESVPWGGEAEGEGCLEGPSEGGTSCS